MLKNCMIIVFLIAINIILFLTFFNAEKFGFLSVFLYICNERFTIK